MSCQGPGQARELFLIVQPPVPSSGPPEPPHMDPQTAPPFDCNLHAPPRPEMGSEQHRLALSKLPGSQSAMLCDDSMCRPTRGIAYCRKISHPTADIVWFSKGEIGIMICMAKKQIRPDWRGRRSTCQDAGTVRPASNARAITGAP